MIAYSTEHVYTQQHCVLHIVVSTAAALHSMKHSQQQTTVVVFLPSAWPVGLAVDGAAVHQGLAVVGAAVVG
jgi:hypothetical protein